MVGNLLFLSFCYKYVPKKFLGKVIDDSQRLDVCINEMRLGQKMLRDFNDKADRDQRDLDLQLAVYKV